MKLGLCTIAFQEKPLEEVIDIAANYGFDGIEIWGHLKPPQVFENYQRTTSPLGNGSITPIENYVCEVSPKNVHRC